MSNRKSVRLTAVVLASLLFATPALAGFDEGRDAYDKGRWIQAIINLRPAAEAGDARAMILLGNMYMEGHGVAQDTKEAFGLYHTAALKENTDGMVATATLYQTGNGVNANTPLAVGWFERAARLGDMDAALVYAIHLYQGSKGKDFDLKPDHEASYRWFRIVAANTKNHKQGDAAKFSAEKISKNLTQDEIIAGDREAVNWKPEMPEAIGPNPEVKFIKDYDVKHGLPGAAAAPGDKAAGDKSSGDKDVPAPAPDKKPADAKDDGKTDARPADKPAAAPDTAATPPADARKPDDKKSGDETGVDDDMPK